MRLREILTAFRTNVDILTHFSWVPDLRYIWNPIQFNFVENGLILKWGRIFPGYKNTSRNRISANLAIIDVRKYNKPVYIIFTISLSVIKLYIIYTIEHRVTDPVKAYKGLEVDVITNSSQNIGNTDRIIIV